MCERDRERDRDWDREEGSILNPEGDPVMNHTPLNKWWVYSFLPCFLLTRKLWILDFKFQFYKGFMSKPYACILAISTTWSIQSNVFKRSVIRRPLKPHLSKTTAFISQCCQALYVFRKSHWTFDNIVSKHALI